MGSGENSSTSPNRRSIVVGSALAAAGLGLGAGVAVGKSSGQDGDTAAAEGSFTVVDRRGRQRLLLETTKPPIVLGGRTYPAHERQGPDATYLIFNDEKGDEKGGIIASSEGAQLSLDYPNGDAVHLRAQWEGKVGGAVLAMRQLGDPDAPVEEARHPNGVLLSTHTEQGTSLMLCDPVGRPRIRLQVAADGTPSIAILDEQGSIVREL
ncbi:hypothetical protein [Nocardia rhamnosiphila]